MSEVKGTEILLNNIDKVQKFNSVVLLYPDNHLDLVSGRYRVDAKSLMGIFSLDLSKPVTMEYKSEYEEIAKGLFAPFLVKD